MRGRLSRALDALKIASGGADMEKVRKALTHGYFANAASLVQEGDTQYETIQGGLSVTVHGSSVLHGRATPTVVFSVAEQTISDRYEIRGVTPIDAVWLPEIAPQLYHNRRTAGPPAPGLPT